MRRIALVLGTAALLGLVGCGDDDDDAAEDESIQTTEATQGTPPETDGEDPLGEGAGEDTTLATRLTGDEEEPGPGDPDGSGTVSITLRPGTNEVCSQFSVENIGPPTAAHIHDGPADEAGPIFITLANPMPAAERAGCVAAEPEEIQAVIDDPAGFYVNVHNEEFPDGAIRGHLEV